MDDFEQDAWEWSTHQEGQCHRRMLELGYTGGNYEVRLALRMALFKYELVHYRTIPDKGGL